MITVRYGAGNQIAVDPSRYSTVASVIGCSNLRAMLGFSDNVEARIGGVIQPMGAAIPSGATLDLTQKASSKA